MAEWKLKIRAFLTDNRTLFGVWFLVGLLAGLTKLNPVRHNNYDIFCGVFRHLIDGLNLYAAYPAEYHDINHYGPVFSLIIAPFAMMPLWLGMTLWCVALAMFLYWAVRQPQFSRAQQIFIIWFCAHELLTALFMQQFNVAIAAIIVFSYVLVEREQEPWAALLIMIGTLVKIYGIVGLAFWLFSKHKGKFILWLIIWAAVLFVAPMAISSPAYIVDQYQEWFYNILAKNDANLFSDMQNISLLGFVRKTAYACTFGMTALRSVINHVTLPIDSWCTRYSDLWIILPGMLLFAAPLLRLKQWQNTYFRQALLASVLMFVCLFSTGTESNGYIIALVGVVLWYTACPWKRNGWDIALLVFVFILTSMSPSDLFPRYIRTEFVRPLALKALPVIIVWLQLIGEMILRDYSETTAIDNH